MVSLKKISAIVLPTVLAVAIIGYMLWRVWDDLLIALAHADYVYLLPAVLICVLSWFLRGYRYQAILANLQVRVNLWLSTACIYLSQTANLIIPARLGDLVRLFILHHEADATYTNGLSSIVVERFFDIVMVALLGVVALFFVPVVPDWFRPLLFIPIVLGVVFLLVLVFAERLQVQNKYLQMGLRLLDEIRAASLSARVLGFLGGLSVIIWLADSVICFVVAAMFQTSVPFATVVLAIVIGNLVKAVPITPGGMGTYEVAVAVTLELAGVAPAIATLIAVIDHLIKNLVTLGGGVVSLYYFGDWAVDVMKKAFNKDLPTREM